MFPLCPLLDEALVHLPLVGCLPLSLDGKLPEGGWWSHGRVRSKCSAGVGSIIIPQQQLGDSGRQNLRELPYPPCQIILEPHIQGSRGLLLHLSLLDSQTIRSAMWGVRGPRELMTPSERGV